jgi:hypothetical protein
MRLIKGPEELQCSKTQWGSRLRTLTFDHGYILRNILNLETLEGLLEYLNNRVESN